MLSDYLVLLDKPEEPKGQGLHSSFSWNSLFYKKISFPAGRKVLLRRDYYFLIHPKVLIRTDWNFRAHPKLPL